jgi:hypothetical protein
MIPFYGQAVAAHEAAHAAAMRERQHRNGNMVDGNSWLASQKVLQRPFHDLPKGTTYATQGLSGRGGL